MSESNVTIGFRGTEEYRWKLKREATTRRLSVQVMIEEALTLYLTAEPGKGEPVVVRADLYQELAEKARSIGRTEGDVLDEALRDYLKRRGVQG